MAFEGLGGGDGGSGGIIAEGEGVGEDGLVGGGGAEEAAVGGEFDARDGALVPVRCSTVPSTLAI